MRHSRRLIPFLAIAFILVFQSSVRAEDSTDQSARNANYRIEVRLDPESKMLYATEEIQWRNITQNPTSELQFHLYLNAFSHRKTTFMLESGGQLRGDRFVKGKAGWVRIDTVSANGISLMDGLTYIQPDDGNPYDSTVVRIALKEPINPGEEINLSLKFTAKLPRVFARTGYANVKDRDLRFFMVGQWFPKLGVLENDGWNCHQFHGDTEFFSDYGVYDVKMTVPDEYVVGSSGKLIDSQKEDSLRTDHYIAEDVHDFSWTAYPGFEVLEDTLGHTAIKILYNPGEEKFIPGQMDYLKKGMAILNEKIGVYPYSTLTVVNPPKGADGAAGMEYPTLITAGIFTKLPESNPLTYSFTTLHEYGHEYFYGLVGSNEFEHEWMDEGLTTFVERYMIDELYESDLPAIFPVFEHYNYDRLGYLAGPDNYTLMKTSWQQESHISLNAYPRTATLFNTLLNYVGEEEFFRFMSAYFDQWHFKHPYPEDLFKIMQDSTEKDISWFIEDYFKSDKTIDYSVVRVRSKEIKDKEEYFPLPYIELLDPYETEDSTVVYYRTNVRIKNKRDGRFPIELIMTFEDSTTIDISKYFDGLHGDKFQEKTFIGLKKVQMVVVDPDFKIHMDLNWVNNSYVVEKESDPTSKYVDFLKHTAYTLLQLLTGL